MHTYRHTHMHVYTCAEQNGIQPQWGIPPSLGSALAGSHRGGWGSPFHGDEEAAKKELHKGGRCTRNQPVKNHAFTSEAGELPTRFCKAFGTLDKITQWWAMLQDRRRKTFHPFGDRGRGVGFAKLIGESGFQAAA